jgi:iron(III) transport system substrate-binding protein
VTLVLEYLNGIIDPLVNPQKRVFVGYLLAAFGIAVMVQVFLLQLPMRRALRALFSSRVWLSKSARSDYLILVVNQAVMMGLAPRLVSKLALATLLFEGLHVWLNGRPSLLPDAPGWVIASSFTLVLFVIDDAAKYILHRMLHKWPILWAFHKVHHTAETLTPITVYRTHPVEGVLFALRATVVQAIAVAGFIFFFGERAQLVTLMGANAVLFLFNATGSNLRHSHVHISYGRWLEKILISPAQHQIHHSVARRHHDKNFGAVLAVWDWICGSLHLAEARPVKRFGIDAMPANAHGMKTLYIAPFFEASALISNGLSSGSKKMAVAFFNKRRAVQVAGSVAIFFLAVSIAATAMAKELNIYSHRQPFLIQPFIDAYTAQTGTQINIVYASKGLAQRLQAEGARSPADVVLTVDIARLYVYADKDLLAPVESDVLTANVPAHLRDEKNRWFAFSKRARVIAVSKQAQDTHSIKTYEELADPKWAGRICARPGSHVYNRALVASIIEAQGMEKAEAWARGLTENLAQRPQGNDRAQVKAIFEGVCDIAIINNYYYGKLLHSENEEQRGWADAVQLIFPNQDDRGTHVNISGGGVAKHSQHKEEALRFLEFLTSEEAQHLYGEVNFEYPVNPTVQAPEELYSWGGDFKEDDVPISRIAELAPDAQRVIDRVGW